MEPTYAISPLLKAERVSKFYRSENRLLRILNEVSIDIFPSETVSIIGKSGSGKTTLLNILGSLDLPHTGLVYYNQNLISKDGNYVLNHSTLTFLRNSYIGFVFQFHHLMEDFSAQENVAFPLFIKTGNKKESIIEASILLKQVGLSDRLNHLPSQLSGGEQQRVSLCRALINKPKIIFADEPTGNLDSDTSNSIYNLMLTICKEQKISFLIVTHSEKYAAQTNRSFEMRQGQLERLK